MRQYTEIIWSLLIIIGIYYNRGDKMSEFHFSEKNIDTKEFIVEFCNQFEKEIEMRGVIKK